MSAFLRERALPAADILTPNLFELEILSGSKLKTSNEIRAAAERLLGQGPRVVLVTSLASEDDAAEEIRMLAVTAEGAWRIATPRLPFAANGAGDAVAALFLGFYLRTRSLPEALGSAASAIFEILQTTLEAGEAELQIVASQDRLESPRCHFSAQTL